mgnify:CR=1 FL=1
MILRVVASGHLVLEIQAMDFQRALHILCLASVDFSEMLGPPCPSQLEAAA